MRVLAADVGSGTTDILVFDSEIPLENCPQLVIPSQTQRVAAAIAAATAQGRAVAFTGATMGGGACTAALRRHLAAGLPFLASPAAALSFHDDLSKAAGWGVTVTDDPAACAPAGCVSIKSGDIDLEQLLDALERLGIETRLDGAAVAVQDHGFSPGESNRRRRFSLWRNLLGRDAALSSLAWSAGSIPAPYTRMRAAAAGLESLPLAVLMDTGPAALWGIALAAINAGPLLAVNAGNGHTLAAVIEKGSVIALVEHHTGMLDAARFTALVRGFISGELSDEEVLSDGGHGCIPPPLDFGPQLREPIMVTGPRRELFRDADLRLDFIAPFGDMMMTGCYGLIAAFRKFGS